MKLKAFVKPKGEPQLTPPMKVEQLDVNGNRCGRMAQLRVPKWYGFYMLLEDCGNLSDNRCSVYEERPEACRQYEVGSEVCKAARAAFGLDGHEAQVPLERSSPIDVRIPKYQTY